MADENHGFPGVAAAVLHHSHSILYNHEKPLIARLLSSASLSAAWVRAPTEAEAVTMVHVGKGQEPKQVMAALEKAFPGAIVQDVSTIPGYAYVQEWPVKEEKR